MTTATDVVNTNDRLIFTLFIAIAAHAVLLLIEFTTDEPLPPLQSLDITIATYSSEDEPEKADFLAQHNQEGSGTENEAKEITAPELAKINDNKVRETNPEEKIQKIDASQSNSQLLTVDKSTTSIESDEKTTKNKNKQDGNDTENREKKDEYAALAAKLAKEKQALANKPKIRRLTSVATRASADAKYLNAWEEKIELIGNNNFPQAALDKRIFGKLRLAVRLKKNGVVERVDIMKSSNYPILDQAAVQIVRLASPFQSIPSDVLQGKDQIEIIRTWKFDITGLSTEI